MEEEARRIGIYAVSKPCKVLQIHDLAEMWGKPQLVTEQLQGSGSAEQYVE